MSEAGVIEGVPCSNKDDEKYQGIDRLINVMYGDIYCFMIVAKPLNIDEILEIQKHLYEFYDKVNEIQIFLASNSSKSPILRKLFNEYIRKEEGGNDYYRLYPPLGTKEAFEIQHTLGINTDENNITAPTGKTGVAYGLIAGCEGGKIKVIS